MSHRLAPIILALALALPASAIPVANASFETGDFTGWAGVGDTTFNGVQNAQPHGLGAFSAFFGAVGGTGGITQNLATVAGQEYLISYFVIFDGGVTSSFQSAFGATTLQTLNNPPASPGGAYQGFSFLATAAAASTALTFNFRDDPGFIIFDDVAVVATPELNAASAVTPFLFIALGLCLAGSRRKEAVAVA